MHFRMWYEGWLKTEDKNTNSIVEKIINNFEALKKTHKSCTEIERCELCSAQIKNEIITFW